MDRLVKYGFIAIFSIVLPSTFEARAADAIIVGPDHSACSQRSVQGEVTIKCNLQGFSVLDFRNKIQIICRGEAATFGSWTPAGAPKYFVAPHRQYELTCYKIPFSLPSSRINVHHEEKAVVANVNSRVSILFNYEPDIQALSICVVPIISEFSVEALCFPAKIEEP